MKESLDIATPPVEDKEGETNKEVFKPTHTFYFSKQEQEQFELDYPDIRDSDDAYSVIEANEKFKKLQEKGVLFAKLTDGRIVPYTESIPLESTEGFVEGLEPTSFDDLERLGEGVEFHDTETDEKERFQTPNV